MTELCTASTPGGGNVVASATTPFGDWIRVESRTIQLTDDERMVAHVVRFPAIALVLALDGDRLVLIRQFRYPPQCWLVEAPAGRVEAHEPPERTAARELREETGYEAGKLELIGRLRISPHLSDETTHVYLGTDLTPGEPHPDKGELIQPFPVPRNQLRSMVDRQQIVDAKTIAALSLSHLI
ncbi:NUDIX hydrolase [Streptomyces sp. NPDC006617]|uniref:NUDIX hydrolase n=1 Tax=Streptomyces sp. NPDC006617 TaxID=3155354 RepID=UPI0033A6E037